MVAVRLHCASLKKHEDYDILANLVNYNAERAAQKLIDSTPNDKHRVTISIIYETHDGKPQP